MVVKLLEAFPGRFIASLWKTAIIEQLLGRAFADGSCLPDEGRDLPGVAANNKFYRERKMSVGIRISQALVIRIFILFAAGNFSRQIHRCALEDSSH